tara:strand:- start:15072 stop:17060 length:1989 start_codon:yes stop_codon:yes gene_type:complete
MSDQAFELKQLKSYQFNLNENFMKQYIGQQPNWGPIGYVTYKRTYARPVLEENRSEEWWETVKRVVQGTYTIQRYHCKKLGLPWNANKAQKSAQEMFKLIWDFKFLPPGRGLWMMGTDFLWKKGGACLNNCSFVSTKALSTDFADPFCFLMDMSMLGVGVGGDTKGAGKVKIRKPKPGKELYTVSDTREGWVELVRDVLNSYVGKGMLPSNISYKNIRPYGEPIKGFGGTSSGPAPLERLVQDLQDILNPMIGEQVNSTAIVDIFNAIGRCVVSGNVRRSAEIMFGEATDQEFLELKDPEINQDMLDKWRWTSNNSVFVDVGSDYSHLSEITAKNGEPGYFWLKTAREYGRMCDPPDYKDMLVEGANPCSEQSLESYELCCLVETFPARHGSFDEYQRTLKFAYLYAKTVTLVKTHNERTNAVMLRNRRIGTSQSGVAQSFTRHGIREHFRWCDEGYKYIRNLDRIYSRWLCVPESIKVTSVKPSGTVSLLPGSTHGIHFPYSEYYWRTIRFDKGSPITQALRDAGYRIEQGETETTAIVYFPVKEENFSRSVQNLTIWEQVEIAAQMQHYWADNQVSVTINFKPEEAKDIKKVLELYDHKLKSISFLPFIEHGYKHAPIQPITRKEYEQAVKKIKPVFLRQEGDTNTEAGGKYCDSDQCTI